MELDPVYCDVVVRRREMATGKVALRLSGQAKLKPKDAIDASYLTCHIGRVK